MIKIVLPEGEGPRPASGTRVYTSDGAEIEGVSRIELLLDPDEVMTAVLHVHVSQLENSEWLQARVEVFGEDEPDGN